MTIKLGNPRHSVYNINSMDMPFNQYEYSRFKFGDIGIANKYGLELYAYFIKNHFDQLKGKKITIFSSPYVELPTSSFYLTHAFYDYLVANNAEDFNGIEMGKIKRNQTYTIDYGNLNATERLNLIKNDTYSFDNPPNTEDFLIFIDDISITGSHQFVVENLLSKTGICSNFIFLYYAKLINLEIPPSIENDLNYAEIKSINGLIKLMKTQDFGLTTRTVKYILSLDDMNFSFFLQEMIDNHLGLLEMIFTKSTENGYDEIDLYKINLNKINSSLKSINQLATES